MGRGKARESCSSHHLCVRVTARREVWVEVTVKRVYGTRFIIRPEKLGF